MQGMATKKLIELHFLNAIRLFLLITRSHIAGYGLAFSASFSAFNHYVLSWHNENSLLDLKKEWKVRASRVKATLFS